MSTGAKRMVTIGLAAAGAIGLAALVVWGLKGSDPKGETPIEVTDGSITLRFPSKFRADDDNHPKQLKASISFRKVDRIEIVDKSQGSAPQTFTVKKLDWTLKRGATGDSSRAVIIANNSGLFTDEVLITSSGDEFKKYSDTEYRLEDGYQFTPAILEVKGQAPTTLSCPSGQCKITIWIK